MWIDALDPKRRYFEDWYEAVSSFTTRNLTFHTDKLPALAGLATHVHNIHQFDYLAGLWKQDLEYGLLWYVGRQPQETSGKYAFPSLLGEEYSTVVPEEGSSKPNATLSAEQKMSQLSLNSATTPSAFLSNKPCNSPGQLHLKTILPILQQRDKSNPKSPSWSWASLNHEKINFLYSHSSLKPSGHPLTPAVSKLTAHPLIKEIPLRKSHPAT